MKIRLKIVRNFLGKEEVGSSNLLIGSTDNQIVTSNFLPIKKVSRDIIGTFYVFIYLLNFTKKSDRFIVAQAYYIYTVLNKKGTLLRIRDRILYS